MFNLRIFKIVCLFSFITFIFLSGCSESANNKKIGIVIPIEHKAIDDIVAGFTQSLREQSSVPITFKIANAQGDLNLQRSIVQQMKDEHYDLVVPVATAPTQMAVAMIHNLPIVGLATDFSEQERKQLKFCNITVVHDNIPPQYLLNLIHLAYPTIQHLTLIHSAADKIFPDVQVTVNAGKKIGIEIKPIMVPTMQELYSIANSLPQDSQGILILKDNLIVSGIGTLIVTAEKKHIPLITSDEGSVTEGATFSLGVHERDIGIAGAKLASAILSGKQACSLPLVEMQQLTLFINQNSLTKQPQSLMELQAAAKQQHYPIEILGTVEE